MTILDGDHVLEKGIRLRLVGAHSPGSQMVEVQGEGRTIVITGDAVLHYANLEKQIPIGTYHSLETAVDVLKQLRSRMLEEPNIIILTSHDPKLAERHPSAV